MQECFSWRLALSAATLRSPWMFVNKLCIEEILPAAVPLGFISSSLDGRLLEGFESSRTASERSLEVDFDPKKRIDVLLV